MPQPILRRSALLLIAGAFLTFTTFSYFSDSQSLNSFATLTQAWISEARCITHRGDRCETMTTTTAWTSPLSGFLDRADPYRRSTSDFQPSRSALQLAVLRNAPADPEGFTLAVFSSDGHTPDGEKRFAVDNHGVIHVLQDQDVNTLQSLVSSVLELPATAAFRNTWVLRHQRTSQPIDRILVPKTTLSATPVANYEEEFAETSVQAFNYEERQLRDPVQGLEVLPDSLWELTGSVLEARKVEGSEDPAVLSYVRGLLGNVF